MVEVLIVAVSCGLRRSLIRRYLLFGGVVRCGSGVGNRREKI